jgi:hypothetical protein
MLHDGGTVFGDEDELYSAALKVCRADPVWFNSVRDAFQRYLCVHDMCPVADYHFLP